MKLEDYLGRLPDPEPDPEINHGDTCGIPSRVRAGGGHEPSFYRPEIRLDVRALGGSEITWLAYRMEPHHDATSAEVDAAWREISERVEANVDALLAESDPTWPETRRRFLASQ